MREPAMQSPLHAFGLPALAKPIDATAGVWANENPLLCYISLRGHAHDEAFTTAATSALGVALPAAPCTFARAGAVKVLWLSPDEWMIQCPRTAREDMLAKLRAALTGIRSQIADNSGGYTEIILLGPNAGAALSHVTVYDVKALGPGRVAGTTFGKSSVYLHREGDGYCLLLRRSFADYIWRYLVRAAKPYGFGVARLDSGNGGTQS